MKRIVLIIELIIGVPAICYGVGRLIGLLPFINTAIPIKVNLLISTWLYFWLGAMTILTAFLLTSIIIQLRKEGN